jgi:L-asparaginase
MARVIEMSILFIQVGGTIDKGYPANDDNHGYAFQIGDPAYMSILKRAGVSFRWRHHVLLRKDSLDMTDKDRRDLASTIYFWPEKKMVVTHGTDTIGASARTIASWKNNTKTVVLTGAMQPEKFRDSDADFNLGMAVAAVQLLPAGVYVVLRGIIVPWDKYKD